MDLMKTEKESLTTTEIEGYISDYQTNTDGVSRLDKLWNYYRGKNEVIINKAAPDPNNPDNRTPVPYGRKIVTTFTGYAYRPKYITYKANKSEKDAYVEQLQATFDLSTESLKTSRAGRNTAIYGYAYELLYIEDVNTVQPELPTLAEPRFFDIDPREIILLYDYSPEPKKQLAIRFYRITDDWYKVEVYERKMVKLYDRKRGKESGALKWIYSATGEYPNFFDAVPIVPYYFGDDGLGLIEPVLPLIDDYDLLTSDSLNEFNRFAHAYMRFVRMSLGPPDQKKEPNVASAFLQKLKYRRIFENLPDKDAVTFLTKDIPTAFIEFMTTKVKDEIHTQSHVPDFKELATGALSGAAIKRMLFDFENVASAAEADFDTGLYERIRLINSIYAKSGRIVDSERSIVVTHKRNLPDDLKESAETAVQLKNAGFSAWLIADSMPDSIVPDVEEELKRQEEERKSAFPDIEARSEEETEMTEMKNEEEMAKEMM